MKRSVLPALVACLLAPAGPACSAQGWSPSGCGREPAPPVVSSASVDRYNASIDRVGAYDDAARAYSACVSRQALAEQNAISNEARSRMSAVNAVALTVQKRIAGNFGALSAQLKASGQKLGAKR